MKLQKPTSQRLSKTCRMESSSTLTPEPEWEKRLLRPQFRRSSSITLGQSLRSPSPWVLSGRILGFDLENRPLAYWYDGETTSEITAFGWKWVGEPTVHTMLLRHDTMFQCDDGTRLPDESAYERFVEVLSQADLVFGHNIRRHDLPMLNSALLRRQKPLLPPIMTTDTLSDYPKRKGLSASLENLASMYGLSMDKKGMSQPMWEAANRLQDDGIQIARERVVSDVLLQEELRDKVAGLLKPPRVWKAA